MATTKKYHIEKNTVQETLIIPLFARKICAEKFPDSILVFDSCNQRGAKLMIRFCENSVRMRIVKICF